MTSFLHYCTLSLNNVKRMSSATRRSVFPCLLIVGMFFFVGLQVGIAAPNSGSEAVKIPDGTVITVTLTEELSSAKNHQNDQIHGIVADEVKVANSLVLAKGASVIGHVTAVEPKGRWGHSGSLAYTLDYAKAVDGSNIRLRASASQGGEQSKAALMLGLSGAFKHGKDTEVANGTSLNAYVDGDHQVTVSDAVHGEP